MSGNGLTVNECVERAILQLPEGDEPVVSDGTDEYALLLRRLCSEVRKWEQVDEQLEEEHLELLIHQSLNEANQDNENVTGAFQKELRTTLSSTPTRRFRIVFPLNIRERGNETAPRTISANTTTIRKLEEDQWDELNEEAKNPSETINNNQSYNEFIQDSSERLISSRHNVFYEFETKARDSKIAISLLSQDLDIILGKLNFTAIDSSLDQTALEELRSLDRTLPEAFVRPGVYLVMEEGEYYDYHIGARYESYSGLRLPRGFGSDFDSLRQFPMEAATEEVDSNIADAFRALQSGLTATTNENAFLYYWRGLEEITLHNRGAKSKEALERTLPLVYDEFDLEILESITEDLAEKRNEIVHSGIESPVYVRDVNLLRQLLFLSIERMLSLRRGKYSRREILGVLKRGLNDKGQLKMAEKGVKEERAEKDSILEEIEGARRWKKERYPTGPVEKAQQTN
ncbi:hypothetical protein [Halobellus salinisoli]|uniref:hypothetical protein n=1 Tax=Halobellus salinisoli TaxID=3108500 RepID=UPI00300A488E